MEGHARMERRTRTRSGKGHIGEKGEEEQEHQEEASHKHMRPHFLVNDNSHEEKLSRKNEQVEQGLLEEHGK
eukprot:13965043-Heterocapsa_arctica.AAC.1